jgi:hypothetical protein
MIEVQLPDGAVAAFPDGTAPEAIKAALHKKFGTPQSIAEGKTNRQLPASTNDAAVYGLADTLGFGFADEVGSGMAAAIGKLQGDPRSMGQIYDEFLARGRSYDTASQAAHPGGYLAGQGVGAIATLPIGGPAVKGAQTLWQGIKAGAKTGGLLGGVYGFGSGEDGLANRAVSAGEGSLLGSSIGAALPLLGRGAESLYSGIRPLFEPTERYATRKVAEAATRAGTTLPDAMQEVNRLQKTNPEVMLADVLGKSGQRLSRAIVNKGGEGAERLSQSLGNRQAGQGERIQGAVTKGLGDPEAYHGNLDTALKALKTNAKPVYEQAYAQPIDYARYGSSLDQAFNRIPPRLQGQVVTAAKDLMRLEGVKSKQIMAKIGPDGRVTFQRLPDVRQWDYIKRGLDKVIEGEEGQAASGGMSQFGRVLSQVKSDLLGVLDEAVPDFAAARKIYSDDLAVKNALEAGRKALSLDPELIIKNLQGMDAAARAMYRAGFARALGDQIGRARYGSDVINRIWNTPSQQARLLAVFGSRKGFQQFARFAAGEQQMSSTFKAISGNSTTAQQLNDLIDAGNPALDLAAHAATSGIKGALLAAVLRWGRTIGGLTEARANQMADLLLSQGMTPELQAAATRQELSSAQKAALSRLINPAAMLSSANGTNALPGP